MCILTQVTENNMINLEIEPIEVHNETMKLEFAFVMFQSLANECYRLQMEQMRFKRQIATNNKYKPKAFHNRSDKKKLEKLKNYEMKNFDKIVNQYVEKTNFMCNSFADQLPDMASKLEDHGTDFMDNLFKVK